MTKRDELIDWPPDAYAMERGLRPVIDVEERMAVSLDENTLLP